MRGARREATREEIIELLGGFPKAADHVIESLRRKRLAGAGQLGEISGHSPGNRGRMLWATAIYWLSPAISPDPYHIGYGTAAAHYGLTTQHRNVIVLVTPVHLRARQVGESRVRIVNPAPKKFFGFEPVDVLAAMS